jgi:transposase
MVREQRDQYKSEGATINSIAEKFGCKAETLRLWIRQDERDSGQRPGPTIEDSEELKRLRRENFELKRANEILRKASAFFAQAELDREPK